MAASLMAGCQPAPPQPEAPRVITAERAARSVVPDPEAQACAGCHPKETAAWQESQHAHANRMISSAQDGSAFTPPRSLRHGSFTTQLSQQGDRFEIRQTGPDGKTLVHVPEAVIGITPLRQYLVPFPGGRLQAVDMAFDPRSNEWFNTFGAENRMPHEWGFWTNRSMNWNSQCAFCHMTDFRKNYDPKSDTYASTWKAMGISCAQCHVSVRPATSTQCPVSRPPETRNLTSHLDNCASCHSRREQMAEDYRPGDPFLDHFRPVLADQATTFYPDGQIRDEDFEYNSFMTSRMGHKGITCLDCHDPHSYQLKLPVQGNALCLSCHLAPGQKQATLIDPLTHSRHALTNAGSSCVECHMSHTTYMQRDARRDHGFTSPDPLLTQELGIPNACNKCHADKSTEWSIGWVQQWYGDKMDQRRARHRARVIDRAQAGDATQLSNLVSMARSEEIVAWRATLLALMRPWAEEPAVRAMLMESLAHEHPLVRSTAITALNGTPGAYDAIKPLRKDASRLVRLDATWATLNAMENDPASHQELVAYLNTVCDQPAGALRQGQRALAEERTAQAEEWMRKAATWDASAVPHYLLGRVLHRNGKMSEAESALRAAADYDPTNAEYPYTLALLYGEMNQPENVLRELQKTVTLDPAFGRAWYNLGLAHAAANRLDEAAAALIKAESLLPQSAEVPYALATVHHRAGQPQAARAAAGRALIIDPGYGPARQMLGSGPAPREPDKE